MFGWRKKSAILFLAAAMTLGGALELQAVAPTNIITYQGRVLSANGVPVSDASLSMKFFFYTASSGGTCVWSNSSATCDSNVPGSTTARTVTLTSGLFTQNLGNTSDTFAAIADATFADNASLYLEVIIGTETLSPRRLITAAPYALNSQTLDGLSSADFDLDRVYDNDSGSALAIDGASGLTFTSSVAANFTVNLASTGDFVIQDNGTAFATFNDSGNVILTGDLTVSGDDLTMGTNTSGFLLVADGLNFNPVALSSDATISSTGALTITANAIALSTDTTGNYVATVADSGNSTVTVSGSGSEGAAVTLNVIDVNCTDCLTTTEIADSYLLNSGDVATGDLTLSDGTTDSPKLTFSPATGTSWELYAEDSGDDLQIVVNTASTETFDIVNGGAGVVDVTIDGGATLGGDLTISGDDLTMGTNTSGFLLVADGLNFNPVALSSDATISSTGALTITANAIALSTDTTGNYVATLADAGGSDFTISGSGSEGAAVTIDIAADAIDFDEMVDAMTLDASTSITMDGTEDFSIVNGGTGGIIVNLTATGDFMVQDNSQAYFTVNDDSTIDIISTATTGDAFDITANSLTTAAAIDLDASHAPTGGGTVTAVDFGLTNAATTAAATYRGLSLSFTNNPSVAGNTEYLLNLSNVATANTTDNQVAAMIRIDNADTSATGSTTVRDGILISVSGAISDGIVDAIDASDANITNALNIGANVITGTTGNIDLDNFDVVGATGNVTLAGDLTISGDDLTMGTNTSGALLVADGLNFNPVVLSGDATVSTLGVLAIAANAIALSTDTTGNYVATLADGGGGDFTIANSGSEGAAVTIALAADAWDFADFEDTLDLDAATDINLGAFLFSIDLDSTGDFAIRDGTTNVALFEDDSTIDITFPTAAFLTIDASTTANTNTTGVIDLNVSAGDAAVDALNIALVQNNGATGGTQATGLELTLEGNDADGDMFGLRVTSMATTNAATGTYDALLVLTNNENTAGAVTDAIRITSGAGTAASITTGLDFDTTDIRTDIELQNDETISNDSDGKIAFGVGGTDELQLTATELAPVADGGLDLGVSGQPFGDLYLSGGQLFANNAFDIDIDDNTASAFTISEGLTNYLAFTTNNTGETATLGNSGLDSLTMTTDNTAATDVGITGGLTVTSGATHNSFTVTSSADTETGALVTVNSLTTGKGLSVTSSSTGFTSGTLLDIDYDASGSLSAKTTTFAEITNGRTNTATAGTLSDNYDLVKLARSSTQNGAGGAFSSVGSVLYVENEVIATAGTITDTANGIEVVMDADGTGHGMIITMGVVGSPAANGVNNQGLVIDVNEMPSADAVFLVRSDADGQPDTEFRVDNDGDFQYDGTASTPASDLAEAYPSAQTLEPGDLVALDSVGGLKIAKTTQPFQGGLFGAISTKPAMRMGADIVGYDVALVGRIPLKVSSEAGAIAVGDPLTASATVGHAMKATRAGMIVGYALESFDGTGIGVINAFIDVGWFAGNVIGTDGRSTVVTDAVVVAPLGAASASAPTFDSFGLSLRGSAWDGNEAAAVEMMLKNVVSAPDDYRLSVRNTAESEVAYITNEGTMRIAGDMIVGGRLYPSDRGTPQTDKYIYYDGSSGPAGDFMRTNAKGWSTGSYDFAEMFPAQEKLISGEVVAFAGNGDTVIRATGSSGERLAGIVSTRPGFLAGENVEGSYPIALAGRVPTKVSVKNGAIAVGDPLTASTSAGVAMKATQSGQIVGYALESYAQDETDNLILAYVNVGYWSGGPQTITIVENRASEMPKTGAQGFEALNMSGNIYLATNELLGIGRLEGAGSLWSIERDGTMKTQALMKTVIDSYQGTKVETVAVTSPEAVVTLTGTSTLVEGKAEVRFEEVMPDFNDVISAIAPIRVIVTPSGPVSLWVVEKDQNHFIVERFVGSSDVEFDWMVVGYRKGYEPEEPEEEEEAEEAEEAGTFVPSVPLVTSDPSAPDEPAAESAEIVVPASPASPDTTLIDPAIDDDGGEPTEEPSEIVTDQAIVAPEEPPAP